MTLREIVDDLELQRFAALKDNAKRANQELQHALAGLEAAKAKQEILKARWDKYLSPHRRYPHEAM